jgi:hypothetical protein
MRDVLDLRPLLDSWPYDPEADARLARGRDGREILQVRLPLGLEQYELEGRPDGQRPYRAESALDYHLKRLSKAQASGQEAAFELSQQQCAELFAEATLYYYRYLHLFQLKDWRRTVRDTARNLRLFDFVNRHASQQEDRHHLEKWRPYILRMHTVAEAVLELEGGRHTAAIELLNAAIAKLEALPELDDETFELEQQRSLAALHELVAQFEQTRPLSVLEVLERQLNRAVQAQEFERAARLRDRIRALRAKPGQP